MPNPRTLERSPEFQLLLASSIHPLQETEIEQLRVCCAGVDWPSFTALVRRHRVTPIVYLNLAQYAADSVPEQVMTTIKEGTDRNRRHIFQLLGVLSSVSQWLAQANIKVCTLKGPLLAQRLYGDASLRTSADLDILIPIEALAEADRVLRAHGCRRTFPASELTPRQWQAYRKEWYNFGYDLPEREVHIELHWAIGPPDLVPPALACEMLANTRPMAISGRTLFTLTDDDLPVYLLIHGAKHNWVRLKWLVDFVAWHRQAGDEDLAWISQMDAMGLDRALAQGMLLAHWLYATPVPQPVQPLIQVGVSQDLARRAGNALLDPDYSGETAGQLQRVRHVFYRMKLKKGLRYKWATLSNLWILPDDWRDFPLPDVLFPLYLPLRPFLWLRRNHFKPEKNPSRRLRKP